MTVTPHHIGICVTDLARSLRFWCDGLGFETTVVAPIGNEWRAALEVDGDVDLTAHFIEKDGFEIELLHFASPEPHGRPSPSRGQLGFTHLALSVDDLADGVGTNTLKRPENGRAPVSPSAPRTTPAPRAAGWAAA